MTIGVVAKVQSFSEGATGSDEALALESQTSADAFALLYYRYRDRAYRYVRTRTSSDEDAQDITQQGFVRAFDKIHQYNRKRGTFAAWLFGIMRNAAVDFNRGKRPTICWNGLDTPSPDNLEEIGIALADYAHLRSLVARLPESKREILILRFVGDLTVSEIAAAVGKRPDAVHKTLSRTLQFLRSELS